MLANTGDAGAALSQTSAWIPTKKGIVGNQMSQRAYFRSLVDWLIGKVEWGNWGSQRNHWNESRQSQVGNLKGEKKPKTT